MKIVQQKTLKMQIMIAFKKSSCLKLKQPKMKSKKWLNLFANNQTNLRLSRFRASNCWKLKLKNQKLNFHNKMHCPKIFLNNYVRIWKMTGVTISIKKNLSKTFLLLRQVVIQMKMKPFQALTANLRRMWIRKSPKH